MGPEGMKQGKEIKMGKSIKVSRGDEDRTGMGGETEICKIKGGKMSDWYGDNQRKAKED